uniref:Glycosyltransferase n=1 Tax=viral metagenome TaxID=1070528 RepID=A0A6C0DAH0_9ZZZZ
MLIILFLIFIFIIIYLNTLKIKENDKVPKDILTRPANKLLNYNKETILLCYFRDYIYLCDWINSNFKDIKLLIYDNDEQVFDKKNTYYISLRYIPLLPNSLPELNLDKKYRDKLPMHWSITPRINSGGKVGFINLEHLTNKYNLDYNEKYLLPDIDVYDYSLDNIKIFGRGIYIPYKNNFIESIQLKSLININKKFDISFVGTPSDRRSKILYKLIELGYKVDIIDTFGKDRDTRIGASKLLLNIHLEDEWIIYEALRCERWRFVGMPILSEKCISPLPDGIIECEYDKIIDKVKEILPL